MKKFPDTDVLYLNVAGTSLVVLDSAEASLELLEKRSSIYSGRSFFFPSDVLPKFTSELGRACP